MNSVERVKALCKERRIPISRLEKDLGFANGYIGQLRKGTFPDDRLIKIAEYLNVSTSFIMGTDEDMKKNVIDKDAILAGLEAPTEVKLNMRDKRDIAKDLDNIMQKLQSGEDGPATFDGQELSPESAELFKIQLESMLTQLKIINKEKYNPNKNKK